MHPDFTSKIELKQQVQKDQHDQHVKSGYFELGDTVYTRNFGYGPKWVQGVIQEITGPVSYKVAIGSAQIVRRHVDQLFSRQQKEILTKDFQEALGEPYDSEVVSMDADITRPESLSTSSTLESSDNWEPESLKSGCQRNQLPDSPSAQRMPELTQTANRNEPESAASGGLRRSVRERKPPAYFKDFVT